MSWTSLIHRRSPRLRRWWRRRVLAHRRMLAALCAAGAVTAAVVALEPAGPPTRTVLVAARDLPAGAVLRAGDLEGAAVPRQLVPAGLARSPQGRVLASPLRRGEPVTDVRLAGPDLLAAYPGLVGVTVRVPDPAVVRLLRPGDVVDVASTDPREGDTAIVASGATVVALPPEPGAGAAGGSAPAGRAVLVGVRPEEVSPLSAASMSGFISVVFRH